jgi:hypothetical protein
MDTGGKIATGVAVPVVVGAAAVAAYFLFFRKKERPWGSHILDVSTNEGIMAPNATFDELIHCVRNGTQLSEQCVDNLKDHNLSDFKKYRKSEIKRMAAEALVPEHEVAAAAKPLYDQAEKYLKRGGRHRKTHRGR